jgi:hypothetical protein
MPFILSVFLSLEGALQFLNILKGKADAEIPSCLPILVTYHPKGCDGRELAAVYFLIVCLLVLISELDPFNIHFNWVGEREGAEWVVREGVGAGGRNEPSLVCTYE